MTSEAGEWSIVTARGDIGKAVYRVRMDQPEHASLYPVNVAVRYPYAGDAQGFPSKPTQEEIDAFEDALLELMWPPGPSCLVLAVTGFNAREWEFQAKSYEEFIDRFNALLERRPRAPVTIEYTDDPGWTLWHRVRDRAAAEGAQ